MCVQLRERQMLAETHITQSLPRFLHMESRLIQSFLTCHRLSAFLLYRIITGQDQLQP
jgi:hypothetical protein